MVTGVILAAIHLQQFAVPEVISFSNCIKFYLVSNFLIKEIEVQLELLTIFHGAQMTCYSCNNEFYNFSS